MAPVRYNSSLRCEKTLFFCHLSQTSTCALQWVTATMDELKEKAAGHNKEGSGVQRSLLPEPLPCCPHCPVCATCHPRQKSWAHHIALTSYRPTHSLNILGVSQVHPRYSGSRFAVQWNQCVFTAPPSAFCQHVVLYCVAFCCMAFCTVFCCLVLSCRVVSLSLFVSLSAGSCRDWAKSEKGLSSSVPDQQRSSSCFPV